MPKEYIVGTRGSLLALTQATQTAKQLEKNTGDKFTLSIIKTTGDLNTSVPLWQMEGKNFFTKELDTALLEGKVDLVIHSHKDLGSERPEGTTIAAVTQRQFAHDILLTTKKFATEKKISSVIHIGTSSPRRMCNLKNHLKNFLPFHDQNYEIETSPLRGNVNTRIQKLKNGEYDAIVLALAGLERLAIDDKAKNELLPILEGLTFMVLPLSKFPSAASQGALAIETLLDRNDHGELLNKIKTVSDEQTTSEVKRERKVFNEFGGGCHLAVGIHVRKIKDQFIHFYQGFHNEKMVDKTFIEGASSPLNVVDPENLFIGLPEQKGKKYFQLIDTSLPVFDELIVKGPSTQTTNLPKNGQFFMASSYGLEILKNSNIQFGIWASGTQTMILLAKNGHWVYGTSDSLGEDEVLALKNSAFINLLDNKVKTDPWYILTNEDSKTKLGTIIPCYERTINAISPKFLEKINKVSHFYWGSFHQFSVYTKQFPQILSQKHFCGLGKTFDAFNENGITVTPIVSLKEFLTH